MKNLSIIIVNYNTKDLLIQCLESLDQALSLVTCHVSPEIIVVDNGSTDGSVEEVEKRYKQSLRPYGLEDIKILRSRQNLGFAKGNNVGIKQARGRFILLLNSDTVVEKNTILEMLKFMEKNPKVGAATCKVVFPDGTLDPACHRGFPTPWASLTYFLGLEKLFPKSRLFGQYHLGFLPMDKPHEIDSPTGAFYLMKREVIDKVGLLDGDYFMYGEDLDWSYRIKQAGWKIMYYPDIKIVHFKKQSGRAREDARVRKETTSHFYETMKIFYQKHYLEKYPRIVTASIMLAIEIKKRLSLITIH